MPPWGDDHGADDVDAADGAVSPDVEANLGVLEPPDATHGVSEAFVQALAVGGDDDVAGLDPGGLGRTAGVDA